MFSKTSQSSAQEPQRITSSTSATIVGASRRSVGATGSFRTALGKQTFSNSTSGAGPKIVADLKVPFILKGVQRCRRTPVHEALREGRGQFDHTYGLQSGAAPSASSDTTTVTRLRTPERSSSRRSSSVAAACRSAVINRYNACSCDRRRGAGWFGVARIRRLERSASARAARRAEHGPDRVRLNMPMISLMPQWAFDTLRQKIGTSFHGSAKRSPIALATAMIAGDGTNIRRTGSGDRASGLISRSCTASAQYVALETRQSRRWTRYSLPSPVATRRDLLAGLTSLFWQLDSSALQGSSSVLVPNTSVLASKKEEWKAQGGQSGRQREGLQGGDGGRAILELCRGRYLTLHRPRPPFESCRPEPSQQLSHTNDPSRQAAVQISRPTEPS